MGNGSGVISYSIAPNESQSARETTLSVAEGRTLRVTQAGKLGTVASVSAANYLPEVAPDSIVAAFGSGLATQTQIAPSLPLPTTLAGSSVFIRDSAGVQRQAQLFLVSPAQINYLLPLGTASGSALVSVVSGNTTIVGEVQVAAVAPGLFSVNSNGQGLAAASILRVKANGAQTFEPVARFDQAQGRIVAVPIDLGDASDQVFLILNGTGWRNRSALSGVSVKIGGVDAEVVFAGEQGSFAGLDQANVKLPRILGGRGEVDVVLSVDGKTANTAKVNIK